MGEDKNIIEHDRTTVGMVVELEKIMDACMRLFDAMKDGARKWAHPHSCSRMQMMDELDVVLEYFCEE